MNVVHISQFYSCSRVTLASELFYICELAKYLAIDEDKFTIQNLPSEECSTGVVLSLDGVILDSILENSQIWSYFRMMVSKGYIVNVNANGLEVNCQSPISYEDLRLVNAFYTLNKVNSSADANKRNIDAEYNLREPLKLQVALETVGTTLVWNYVVNGSSSINCDSFNRPRTQYLWLSLIAMVAVKRIYSDVQFDFRIEFVNDVLSNTNSVSYVLALYESSNCFKGWFSFSLSSVNNERKLQLPYYAWYQIGKDKGYLSSEYSNPNKLQYMKELGINVGDFVFLYKRNREQIYNHVKTIDKCSLARVDSISRTEIGFTLINTMKTKEQAKLDYENLSDVSKQLYGDRKLWEEFHTSNCVIELVECGVEYMMFDEEYFILPLESTNDFKEVHISPTELVTLPQNEFIYWVLKDYDAFDNEEHEKKFIDRYIKGVPMRTQYYENLN